jgi:hypothetical protein
MRSGMHRCARSHRRAPERTPSSAWLSQDLLAAVDPAPQGGLTQGWLGGGWVLFGFHDACDGTASVFAALAPYELLISDSIPLAFLKK